MKIKTTFLRNSAKLPSRAHDGDSGADIFICFPENDENICVNGIPCKWSNAFEGMNGHENEILLEPGNRICMPSGISTEIPYGYEIQLRPRSGYAIKDGITILNSPGTIDSTYKGEIGIIIINHDKRKSFKLTNGMKIAQMVVTQVIYADYVTTTDANPRYTNGFGSTG